MALRFTKMHGLGNDFMVLDLVRQDTVLPKETIRALANRRTGIGFDQLLIIETPTDPDCDFRYRIYNADGSESEHCANGARCIARFVLDQGLSISSPLKLQMPSSVITCQIHENGQVTVDMGAPILQPADIPFIADAISPGYSLSLPNDQTIEISAVSMGNPHAVLIVDDVNTAPVDELGPVIENHTRFPNRVNVGFMQIVNPNSIRLRVYERGTGETQACGTGACAAVVAGQGRGLLEDTVTVELIGGTLSINCNGDDSPVLMTGPATTVYEGQLDL
jgi:diaminopimelate epimerase